VGLDDLRQERRNSRVQLLAFGQRALEHGGDVVERFGHRRVERGVRERDVLTRRDRAELELVAREGERARAVAVAGIARELRQHADADIEHPAVLGRRRPALLNLLEDVGQHERGEDLDRLGRPRGRATLVDRPVTNTFRGFKQRY